MPLDPDKLAEIVGVARELDSADRADYINDVTQGDPLLRKEIEQTLKALSGGAGSGDRPRGAMHEAPTQASEPAPYISGGDARPSAADQETRADARSGMPSALRNDLFAKTEMPGSMIGRYKLLQKIGEGGFGAVYMAEQEEPVRRRVALKVIKAGMDSRQVIARFEAERQALAMMDHPFIARVLDAGATESGRPYFVMELVKGIPITQYCDQARLDTRGRLTLFTDICAAIQHAHHKGIIHRDLKPSNIMVTLHGGEPIVKVIDFGIAKATDQRLTEKTLFTNYGQMIGTPAYMSPEQAVMSGLDVDTRSDIYSLGVLLYELLTGNAPLDDRTLREAGFDEMRRLIREQSPPKPSTRLSTMDNEKRVSVASNRQSNPQTLGRELRGDLDWIVMKALEKDRSRRYESASSFAQDITRYLNNEPVEAAAPSTAYRVRKYIQRHKGPVGVAVTIVLLLVIGTAVSTWLAIRATRAEGQALENLKTAESERDRATKAEQLANASLAQAKADRDAKEKAARDAEAIAAFFSDVLRRPNPREDGRGITVVQALDRAAAGIEADLAQQPRRQARLRVVLGNTYYGLGLYEQAVEQLERAREYLDLNAGPDEPDTLEAMESLSFVYHETGKAEQAKALRQTVLERRSKLLGPENNDTIRAMSNVANSLADSGEQAQALELREQVLRLSRQVHGPEHELTLTARTNLANSYHDADRREEALKLREDVLPLYAATLGPHHPDTIKAMSNLANSYSSIDRHDKALRLREQAAALSEQVLGEDHPDTFLALENLATSLHQLDRLDEARELRERAVALRRQFQGPDDPRTLMALSNLANSYNALDQKDKALALRQQVADTFERLQGRQNFNTLIALHNLANSYQETDRWDDALALRREVLGHCRTQFGERDAKTIWAMDSLATTLAEHGESQEAIDVLAKASAAAPADMQIALKLAALYVWFGQQAQYDAMRQRVLRQTDTLQPGSELAAAVRLLCLGPGMDESSAKAVDALRSRVLSAQPAAVTLQAKALISVGLAAYRASHTAAALEHLSQARKALGDEARQAQPEALAVTAMLYSAALLKQSGKTDQAIELFGRVQATMKPMPADLDKPLAGQADYEALMQWLAYREVKAVFE